MCFSLYCSCCTTQCLLETITVKTEYYKQRRTYLKFESVNWLLVWVERNVDQLCLCWVGFHNQGITHNVNPYNCWPTFKWFTRVVLANTTDVYVHVHAKVNYIFCFCQSWYICLKYVDFFLKYFGLNFCRIKILWKWALVLVFLCIKNW